MPNLPPCARTALSRNAGCVGAHWVLALLMLCIGLQAALLPAQRIASQAHFHRASQSALEEVAEHMRAQADGPDGEHDHPPHAATRHDDISAPQATAHHHHSDVAHHDHADEPHDVVHVDEDSAEPGSPTHALKRVAGDADGLLPAGPCRLADAPVRVAPSAGRPSYASHVVPPMERPPRHMA